MIDLGDIERRLGVDHTGGLIDVLALPKKDVAALVHAVRAALTHAGAFHCVPLSPGHFYNSSDGDLADALAPFRETP